MISPDWLHFFERIYPSANMVLIRGDRPVLIDTGFGSDFPETERLLRDAGVSPQQLSLIVNTHYHCDHAGGNHGFQQRHGLPIATYYLEARLINQRDREVCSAEWLDQEIEAYQVNRALREGDEIDTGRVRLQVLHTPGHTLGHIALYAPEEQVLICGDVVHRDDVAWIGIFREGVGALQRMMETLDRVAQLPLRLVYSGHGPAMGQPLVSIDAARRRYEKWLKDPEKLAWHACKRIFAYKLMMSEGFASEEITPYLLQCAWYLDYTRHVFMSKPAAFVKPFLDEMLRSGAAVWRDGRLVALTTHNKPPKDWPAGPARPKDWSQAINILTSGSPAK